MTATRDRGIHCLYLAGNGGMRRAMPTRGTVAFADKRTPQTWALDLKKDELLEGGKKTLGNTEASSRH